jgi:cyclopropane-fatty-acyl-phospholipid synthase
MTDIDVMRLYYRQKFRTWQDRLNENREGFAEVFSERSCYMWEFYTTIFEAVSRHGGVVNSQIHLSNYVATVPLIRSYISAWERTGVSKTVVTDVVTREYSSSAQCTEKAR